MTKTAARTMQPPMTAIRIQSVVFEPSDSSRPLLTWKVASPLCRVYMTGIVAVVVAAATVVLSDG